MIDINCKFYHFFSPFTGQLLQKIEEAFRRSAEVPIYRIEKNPRFARRQGAYSVVSATGLIMRRGHELDRVLRVLDKGFSVVTN